jgi:NAD-dependent deacetylase
MFDGRVLVITGAGISAESGIPTFRGKDGYWRNLDPAKLATPEAFAKDPQLVWEWYRERRQRIRAADPNAAHDALVKLAAQSRDFLLVTQNVDDLHTRARWDGQGLLAEKIVRVHGDIFLTKCSGCDFGQREPDQDRGDIPECPRCGARMRPGVVWFGEQLDAKEIGRVESFLEEGPCDMVVVIGTTAMFGYILDWAVRAVGRSGELIEVNPEETSISRFATKTYREPAAIMLPTLVDRILTGRA